MACRGVHFALTGKQERELLAAGDDEGVRRVIETIETAWDEEHLAQSDKAWDAIVKRWTGSARG